MRLIITRHAQTKENEDGRLQGPLTGDFTVVGKKQLACLKKQLKSESFDAIFSSDLRRCVETTKRLFPDLSKVKFTPLLREKNNGDFE
ncbi:MAG: histidine phosphatase family protein [Patescibacteria group bacterium]